MNSEFLTEEKLRGIVKIENMMSGKVCLISSEDIVKSYSSLRFSLDMGTFSNKMLQDDYDKTGLELFNIEKDVIASKDEDLSLLLEKRKGYYRENSKELY
ncbi:MAG TPA: hypothetical protein IAB12_00990 [Candidatus Ornithospirochaeta avicola]|uniref:Uncharacterized protein n=1 Tax=Candidatus Ornithospirochaeta avicola TaxID=2840896 RepID=A0A9D1TNE0_9SPIO|nr:hypothetical protein [Candidatus Ornithospirochaeta avicola]